MGDQPAPAVNPPQVVRVGVVGYKVTDEKIGLPMSGAGILAGTLLPEPIPIGVHPPVATESPEVALVPAEDVAPAPVPTSAPTVATEQEA